MLTLILSHSTPLQPRSPRPRATCLIASDALLYFENLTLTTSDATATEPHSTFYQPVAPDPGTFQFAVPNHWAGGTILLSLSGSATYGTDYSLRLSGIGGNPTWSSGPQAGAMSMYIPAGVTQVIVPVNPIGDTIEAEPDETVVLSVSPFRPNIHRFAKHLWHHGCREWNGHHRRRSGRIKSYCNAQLD